MAGLFCGRRSHCPGFFVDGAVTVRRTAVELTFEGRIGFLVQGTNLS
jgi:hypothetical protein